MHIVRIAQGSAELASAEKIGSKAANLARMAAMGLPVPPAIVLPIALCAATLRGEGSAAADLKEGIEEGIKFLEETTGKRFGDRRRPLLVSVRSGAARSLPGMMDTILNVGCTSDAVHGLVRLTGRPRFAFDCRRRFLESYAGVALGIDRERFARRLTEIIKEEGIANEQALDCEALERLGHIYEQLIEDQEGALCEDPREQLVTAARAVFQSWMSERACTYRKMQHLEDLQGTAVTVQAMVFGNGSYASGAGVAFSRDSSTGAAQPVIDVLFEAQGEEVVSGSRTPESDAAIVARVPAAARQLREILAELECKFGDVQDVEFTIEDGKLWILQTRSAKRTPLAALRFAVDFKEQGLISREQALEQLEGIDLNMLARQRFVDPPPPVGQGTAASAGIAIGRAAFDSQKAMRVQAVGDPVILVRPDTSTADVAGFATAAGILTAVGGRTAHAALVARQMGKPCVVGCTTLTIDTARRSAKLGGASFNEGDWLSIDGETGAVYLGRGECVIERPDAELAKVAQWRAQAR